MSKTLPQSSYTSLPTCNDLLANLERAEADLLQHLEYVNEMIDKKYTTLGMGICNITKALSGMMSDVFDNDTLSYAFGKIGLVVMPLVGGLSAVSQAQKYNDLLDEMLGVKISIAEAKYSDMKKLTAIATKMRKQVVGAVQSSMHQEYDLDSIKKNHAFKYFLQAHRDDVETCRLAIFTEMVCKYMLAEYDAWLSYRQCSDYERPNMMLANKLLLDAIGVSYGYIEAINPTAKTNKLVKNKALVLADPQLASTCAALACCSTIYNAEESKKERKRIDFDQLSALGMSSSSNLHPLQKRMLKENKAISMVRRWSFWHRLWNKFGGYATLSTIAALLLVAGVIYLFTWLSWAVWLRWILGIISVVILSAISGFVLVLIWEAWDEGRAERKLKLYYKIKFLSGWEAYVRPSLEHKSLLGEFFGGVLSGMAFQFFKRKFF